MSLLYNFAFPQYQVWASAVLAGIPITNAAVEHFIIGYFDAKRRLIQTGTICSGSATSVEVPFRKITQDALVSDAHIVVLAHNHPSGDAQPSRADIDTTRVIARLFAPLDISVADHLIITRNQVFSFREAGLL
jgi:DNA repair protein RadC